MSITMVTKKTVSVLGSQYLKKTEITADNVAQSSKSVPAAKTGTLTVRTDDNTGSLTMTAGHGITTAAVIDLFWVIAGVYYSRYGMTVGTVATNVVPIDGGTGDVLPADAQAITAMVHITEPMVVTGNDVVGIALFSSVPGYVKFLDASDAVLWASEITEVNGSQFWDNQDGSTNPLAGDAVAKVAFSHGDSTGAKDMRAAVLFN